TANQRLVGAQLPPAPDHAAGRGREHVQVRRKAAVLAHCPPADCSVINVTAVATPSIGRCAWMDCSATRSSFFGLEKHDSCRSDATRVGRRTTVLACGPLPVAIVYPSMMRFLAIPAALLPLISAAARPAEPTAMPSGRVLSGVTCLRVTSC